jgi:DNA polymerase
MTAAEKKSIYTLLKTTKSWTYGYTAPEFKENEPSFTDDIIREPLHSAVSAQDSTAASSTGHQAPIAAQQAHTSVQQVAAPAQQVTAPTQQTGITIESIAAKISSCHNCILSKTRTNVVPGEGVAHPIVMVIGEGPGEDEDKSGRPFVGKAGQLLDKMLAAIELDRTCNCYIANIVKCRPPMNRTPMPDEAAACQGYLEAQIHLLKPVLILAAGRTAVQNLLHTTEGINALRGKFFDYHLGGQSAGANQNNTPAIPLMATYHPSALLRDENLKRPAWEDLKAFRVKLLELSPDYAASFNENHKA